MTVRRPPTRRAAPGIASLAGVVALATTVSLSASAAAVASAAAPCTTSGLVVWLNDEPGGGTAGSVYYKLELTNLSGRACTLRGYPRVSAVDLHGRPLGGGASRETARKPRLVTLASGTPTLANGTTATAVLRILDAGAISGCRPVIAAGLRVYPPGQATAKVVPFPIRSMLSGGAGQSRGGGARAGGGWLTAGRGERCCPRGQTTSTGVPSVILGASHAISGSSMRMQPCEGSPGIACGSPNAPWMPTTPPPGHSLNDE